MIRNYLTTALRNLRKNPVFTFINVVGLSLGMATFILIFQYITFEKSVNKFHTNLPNLYRVLYEVSFQNHTNTWTSIPPAIAPLARDQFQEVKEFCRVLPQDGIVTYEATDKVKERSFREQNAAYADGNFFNMFSFDVLEGNPETLKRPDNVAMANSYAIKYFGSENAIGKTIILNNQFGRRLYTVTCVYRDFPVNSDLQYNFIFSLETLANPANLNGNNWAKLDNIDAQFIETYLLTSEGADYKDLEAKLNAAKKKIRPEAMELARLQPMENTHLSESLSDYYTTSGNLSSLYILEGIALLILAIAWFNYINLSTAGALKRAKEVGIRKVVGASRMQLIRQFMGESLVLNAMSLLIALAIVNLLQGSYNRLVHHELGLGVFGQNWLWITGFFILLVGSFASGSYSAFALSSFKPSQTLKGIFSKSAKGITMRKTLVVFQFSMSIMLIGSTVILYKQLIFMQTENLGVRLDQLMSITEPEVGQDSTFNQRSRAFVNDLAQQSFVKDYSQSGTVPGNWYNYNTTGYTKVNPAPNDEHINYSITYIDDRYLHLFDIALKAGKNFTRDMCDRRWARVDKVIINESASSLLGFESPEVAIGQIITNEIDANKSGSRIERYEIIGVVKDYHHMSLHREIDPIFFFPRLNSHYFTVELSADQLQSNIPVLESLYKKYFPGNPFEFFFVDEKFNRQYESELQYGALFSIASGLAIFIACLGLFGLATFTVEQRKKEIGIRKVLGANVFQITRLFSKDFLALVFIAVIIATPIAWYAMDKWLQGFAYRTQINWWIFGLSGLAATLIAVITISSQSVKAALGNPVESLRSE